MGINHEYWMQQAIQLARKAADEDEVPVGAIIVKNDQLIAEGWNQPIQSHDPSAHAELMAIRNAGQVLNNYRLIDTTMYVTLEPCSMCVGAMIHARVKQLVFGASDLKTGATGSAINLIHDPIHNHKIEVTGGVMEDECREVLQYFFKQKRERNKNK
ncbi:MAG: tRNA adenosine(34) deaminase TadA [endosymbiont of Galathealinum brachiosum]|uniref:tRNA-specific adenosine deaminase n=1 Tax=endosymbiont of Galathealinum brachiosum TaxID=2200906 RepID=A0A370DIL7_9GAMM|nr:MAG: tRNA adenosine(34) deaminase TadA [endosymbiont of Galathealinum brachiosum]